jgi:hypothetical protein
VRQPQDRPLVGGPEGRVLVIPPDAAYGAVTESLATAM